ncbi:hypothetical protein [Leeuwenhoekiella parthenopeia]|uniref:Uncharacterized protein n=1 Tax=Leeuwenhoekiella parthenopeia TaxID=2890320 RepID=A0ABS8GT20_9FLAO|nr:hypothetical protein [Leeuwenhoekiella parthenopeia]MCC4212951.1 hypothetical protein [Leeuwenhoekiella parthenopeia]
MVQSEANVLVAVLFQMRALDNLLKAKLSVSGFSVEQVDAQLKGLMAEALRSDREPDFWENLIALRDCVKTTRQNLEIFEELNSILLQIETLVNQSGIKLNSHV